MQAPLHEGLVLFGNLSKTDGAHRHAVRSAAFVQCIAKTIRRTVDVIVGCWNRSDRNKRGTALLPLHLLLILSAATTAAKCSAPLALLCLSCGCSHLARMHEHCCMTGSTQITSLHRHFHQPGLLLHCSCSLLLLDYILGIPAIAILAPEQGLVILYIHKVAPVLQFLQVALCTCLSGHSPLLGISLAFSGVGAEWGRQHHQHAAGQQRFDLCPSWVNLVQLPGHRHLATRLCCAPTAAARCRLYPSACSRALPTAHQAWHNQRGKVSIAP